MALSTDELLKIGQKNLTDQDSTTSSVNATNRIFSRSPGVGAPGSTPATDQTNTNLAASMDRADLGSRFGFGSPQYQQGTETPVAATQPDQSGGIDIAAVHARRNQILNGVDPDAPARFPNPKRSAELNHELGTLTNVVHEHSLETVAQAHQDLIKQRSIDIANQASNVFNGLKGIPMDGTPQSAQRVQDLISQNRNAFDVSPAVREEVSRHAKVHDAAAAAGANQAPSTPQVDPATGLAWNGSRWVSPPIVAGAPAGRLPANKTDATAAKNIHDIYGFTPTQFGARSNVAETDSTGDGKVGGGFVTFTYPDKGKPTQSKPIPKDDFLKLHGTLAPESMPAAPMTPATGAPAAAPSTEVTRVTKDGRSAVYDANTKQFLRYAK